MRLALVDPLNVREGRHVRHREGERPVGGYKLISFLGEGGYGEVWKATAPGGLPCALKFIKLDNNAGLKELKSIGLVKKLRHPNLVPLSAVWLRDEDGNTISEGDNGESFSFRVSGDKELVIAMGLGSGSLADKLAGARSEKAVDALPGGLSLRKLLGYMQDAARGIDCLNNPAEHGNPDCQPLAHCDIKPANLLLVGGCVQVCDYGVAKAVGKDIKKTMAAGTAAYAPPELINNDPGLKSDQYSLAISYYELRTGHLPLDENKALMAHLMGQLDFSRVPAEERDVLQQATSIRTADRFPTCEEFVEALHISTGRTVSGTGVYAPPGRKPAADTSGEIDLEPAPPPPPPKPRPTSDVLRPAGDPVLGYKLEKMLGQGGYGQVWQAVDEDGVACALKILRDVQGKGKHEYDALKRLRKLDHPNLLRIEELWVLDEYWAPIPRDQIGLPGSREARRMVIRTPLADKNLFQKLTECRRHSQPGIPPTELLRYLRQAADALDYLNIDQQIQHRDVKPENLLLKGEVLWVSDFGLAKVVPSGGVTAQSTSSGMTQEYVSPEVLTNKQITDRSDQYSLAVTYHVLRTGRLPFPPGLSMYDLIQARATGSLDLSELTDAERPILRRSLSAHPGDRFPTCRELLRELAHALDLTTKQMPAVGPLSPPPSAPMVSLTAPAEPAKVRKTPAVHTTLEFPTTETRVKFEADPLEPEPTSEWKSGPRTKPARKVPGFKEEEGGGGGKLVLAGLAAVAVAGLAAGGWFLATRDAKTVASGGMPSTPTSASVVPDPPKPGPEPVPGVTPPDPPPAGLTAAQVRQQALAAVAGTDRGASLRALDQVTGPGAADWQAAWRPLLSARKPTAATLADLEEAAKAFPTTRPAGLSGPDAEAVLAARRKLVTEFFEAAYQSLKFDDDKDKVATALIAADPNNERVAVWRADADRTATGLKLPTGFDKYLQATGNQPATDTIAEAVPADEPAWFDERRAGKLANLLAAAVVKARTNAKVAGTYTVPADRVALWLVAADRAAGKVGAAGEAVRRRLAPDAYVVADTLKGLNSITPPLSALAERAKAMVTPADLTDLSAGQKDRLLAGLPGGAGKLAALAALRQLLKSDTRPEELAKGVYAKLDNPDALVGGDPDAGVTKELVLLLGDAGRKLFHNREKWAQVTGFGKSATEVLLKAAGLLAEADKRGQRPDDAAWYGIALLKAGREPAEDVIARAGSGPAGLVFQGMAIERAGGGMAGPSIPARQNALGLLRDAIQVGREQPDGQDILALAYKHAGDHAIALANADGMTTVQQRKYLDEAEAYAKDLDQVDRDRNDGLVLLGCVYEDRGWLLREPLLLSVRCGSAGPYATADKYLNAAIKRQGGRYPLAEMHRGRNLFKWAEDQAQLGRWREQKESQRKPDETRLKAAEDALAKADKTTETLYWLANISAIRYEATEQGLRGGDADSLAKTAADAIGTVAGRTDTPSVAWRRLALKQLLWLHMGEAHRHDKAKRANEAVTAADAAAEVAKTLESATKTIGVSTSELYKLHVLRGQLHYQIGYDDPKSRKQHWPPAHESLTRAVELNPVAPDIWKCRYSLGDVEVWFGEAFAKKAAENASPRELVEAAATHHTLAVNHFREAQYKCWGQVEARQATRDDYDNLLPVIKQRYITIAAFFGYYLTDVAQPDGRQAVWRLAYEEVKADAPEIVKQGMPADMKKRIRDLSAALDADRTDTPLIRAGRAIADRLKAAAER